MFSEDSEFIITQPHRENEHLDEDLYPYNSDGSVNFNGHKRGERASIISILLKKLFPPENGQVASLSDEVLEYKKRISQSKQKLETFFGLPTPIDVNIIEIEAHGLKALLQSRVPMCYFMYSMLEDYSVENLFFILEVEQFECTVFNSTKMKKRVAMGLYTTFVKNGADFEVNLDEKNKTGIIEKISKGDQYCFSGAKEHILKLIEPKVQLFKNSYVFEKMRKELGYTSIYKKSARNAAVRILLRNLDENLPTKSSYTKTSKKGGKKNNENSAHIEDIKGYSQKRNHKIRGMIHAFCIIRLGVDFIDRNYRVSSELDRSSSNTRNRFSTRISQFDLNEKRGVIDLIDFDEDNNQDPDPFELYLETLKT